MQNKKGLTSFCEEPLHPQLASHVKLYPHLTVSGGGNFSSKAFLLADLLERSEFQKEDSAIFPILWVTNDVVEQENVSKAIEDWTKIPIFRLEAEVNQTHLLRALRCFLEKEKVIVVAPFGHLMQNTPNPKELEKNIVTLEVGEKVTRIEVFEKLIAMGYAVSEDQYIEKGQYRGVGEVLNVFPVNADHPLRIVFEYDTVSSITAINQEQGEEIKHYQKHPIYPLRLNFEKPLFFEYLPADSLYIEDELEVGDESYDLWDSLVKSRKDHLRTIEFTAFPEDTKSHLNFRYLSVLKYQDFRDLTMDLQEKRQQKWRVLIFTKYGDTLRELLKEKNISFEESFEPLGEDADIRLISMQKDDILPHAFQNTDLKFLVVTDREIANLKETTGRSKASQKVFWEFLTSLKTDDLVVHIDHGIARFGGLEKRTVDGITREYLKLNYAENDKLFVPIDQADKVNKFIGAEEQAPRLTRLGSAEWSTITKKVRQETEKIARELLDLYAQRKQAKGFRFEPDTNQQAEFEKTFPYEETPGQIKAILDVKKDMERNFPADRLICGDVGFGKTEVALRAAFKAVQNKKQAAFISPITILADQHFRTFKKRMDTFHIRVEMLSRFRSHKEQKEILEKLGKGEIDIIIGTHRLLQKDVKFKDLGLVIIDEEQRFGVKQKEKFKQLRTEVDIITLTATPIPRTLNICLNKLRDITTITTPPPGRLPVITEVRRFSNDLIREAILRELKRGGQIYFLHNRVQTIDGMAEKLQALVPEARFAVTHGKLMSKELERRILDFKDGKFDVLVSSAIIENGIDLANANTLIVNNAERFGLAQLYQLRGRVGRGKAQAYAYFLYHAQRLRLDAKKRLRAIVEASELGSGFQIAMKDLEIRGAGDILGVKQHGVINVIGVSHFIRMLNKAVEDLQAGRVSEEVERPVEVAVELPIPAFIPDHYIVNSKDKINVYQRMSAADSVEYLEELREDVLEDYGKYPREVANLFKIIELKILAKHAGLTVIKAENVHMKTGKQIVLYMGKGVKPENIIHLLEYNAKFEISGHKLKVRIEDLGLNWLDELKECVTRLGKKVDKKTLPEKPMPLLST